MDDEKFTKIKQIRLATLDAECQDKSSTRVVYFQDPFPCHLVGCIDGPGLLRMLGMFEDLSIHFGGQDDESILHKTVSSNFPSSARLLGSSGSGLVTWKEHPVQLPTDLDPKIGEWIEFSSLKIRNLQLQF